MNKKVTPEPLFNDEYASGPAAKRVLGYIQSRREQGASVAGLYCAYAPMELIFAMDIVPAGLCSFSDIPIEAAEEHLPANLCPLIKSSYGFVISGTCPFYGLSDVVIAETTCDGKKKMFEMMSHIKPLYIMDLPQVPNEKEARDEWKVMILKLKSFMETHTGKTTTDEKIENCIQESNRKNSLMMKIFEYGAVHPPVINWNEINDIISITMPSSGDEILHLLEDIIEKLETRVETGFHYGNINSPRVMVTGCPVGGDALKIYRIIEDLGGVVVALDACSGMKTFMDTIDENTGDPIGAIAERYLRIPCSCMTPNERRLTNTDAIIEKYRPDVVIDFVLHACHTYNVESYKVGEHVKNRHNLPFLKIVTDYSDGDIEQIKTRVQALFESIER
ncbi:MAG TPA: double-cubane-cluster-containing anaerobic reductase [Spirochaetota bacterium]|nr:double-cubane-cluster-containing anaerobic reductase [Spirochaetota bacterium]HQO01485.1 double-cubane-cluster-containing anaerobic reductase [Spirochaetota bacterium]